VEFALVAIPFITLVFGAIDFGYAVNNDVMINNAAREGAREGSLNPNAAAITAVVDDSLSSTPGTPVVTVTCKKASGGACAMASATSGDIVVVQVTLHHDWITPLGDTFSSGGIDLTKTSEMRIE
jgi:Flp pilus assembly protein TadG